MARSGGEQLLHQFHPVQSKVIAYPSAWTKKVSMIAAVHLQHLN
jgi:hypothetical protein